MSSEEKRANREKEYKVQGECWDKRQAHKRMKMTEEMHVKIHEEGIRENDLKVCILRQEANAAPAD